VADVLFDEVNKVYENGVRAVQDLSLEIHDGEFLVLVGPSGCGKTTALRMVAGLEEISGGKLSIGGRVVNDLTPKERDIAMVFQNYALYPHLSVAENIAFGLRLRKTAKNVINERVAWAAKLLDLTPYLDRRPKQLSGGQRQRVAMGRAIVRQPQVFLMDEPLSNLDAKLRVQMRADIAKLQRELATTTVYVTHDQVEAMTMGDRVAVMSQGVLQQVDAPQRLYDRPANLFVAGFIGTPPMNLLEGSIVTQDGGVAVDLGGQRLTVPDATLAHYPKLREAVGRAIVAGVRAGDLHLAAARPDLPTLTAQLELVEALGSESIAYFKIDVRVVRSGAEGIEEAVEEEAGADGGVTAARPNLVAALEPHEALGLKFEDRVPVAVNVAAMHFFDAESGEPLR
jgi:multiple sugar transport system ATP-binding protein